MRNAKLTINKSILNSVISYKNQIKNNSDEKSNKNKYEISFKNKKIPTKITIHLIDDYLKQIENKKRANSSDLFINNNFLK